MDIEEARPALLQLLELLPHLRVAVLFGREAQAGRRPPPSPAVACSDHLDNDGDGLTDWPNDPGCADLSDPLETNADIQCDDGLDNDGDGKVDFSRDPDCSSPLDTTEGSAPSPPPKNCAASYPDVCIPPPPPDLDCKDIPYRNFRVIYNVPAPDPHHFDGDHDGIGCES